MIKAFDFFLQLTKCDVVGQSIKSVNPTFNLLKLKIKIFKIKIDINNTTLNIILVNGLPCHFKEVFHSHIIINIMLKEEWFRADSTHHNTLKTSNFHVKSDCHLSFDRFVWLKLFSVLT